MKNRNDIDFKHPKHHVTFRYCMSFIAFLVVLGLFIALGYLLANLLFSQTGRLDELAVVMTSALLGIIFMAVFFNFWLHFKGGFSKKGHVDFGRDILDALDRISQGDFNVEVSSDIRNPLSDLAYSVNKMARELGNLEQQRQEFISNVSHEIQSPLTSIHGFATLLKNPKLSKEDRLHYLEIIETESQRLSKLSDSLLRLSALDGEASINPQNYRLDSQLQSIALMLEPHWSAKRILLEEEAEKIEILADKDLLDQVWINLLQNAIKFTPNKGNIKVSLEQQDSTIICKITDDGIGIATADLPHIFERFYRADKARERSQGGNGLGLAVVKRIIELHNGSISVSSELGQGTVFTVSLPVWQ